jgi:hemerythrin-like domain-containing protein
MITTLSQATEYIVDTIKHIDPENNMVDETVVREIVEDELMEKLEETITDTNVNEIIKHADDEQYVQGYLETKVPNYYTILNTTVKEVLADYIMD